MNTVPPKALLIDWGGTLCAERLPPLTSAILTRRLERFRDRFPSMSTDAIAHTIDSLEDAARRADAQNSDEPIQGCARLLGLDADLADLRACVCIPARETTKLLPGAADLLMDARAIGLARVVVSNSFWRDAAAYRQDFADLELGDLVDDVVTSIETGSRKPDLTIFHRALRLADCRPDAAIYVGNDEVRDVIPARALGMYVVRVAIEEPPPAASNADAVATSLDEARVCLRDWAVERTV